MSDLTDFIASAFGIPSEPEPLGDAVQRALRSIGSEPNAAAPSGAAEAQPPSEGSGSGGWPVVYASSWHGVEAPPRRWCVPRFIPDHVVTLLYGDGGTGKSLIAQQLATCCALGLPFLGIELARRKVLYLAAEDDIAELHRRQQDIAAGLEIELSELDDQLCFRAVSGDDSMLAVADNKSLNIKPTPLYKNLFDYCVGNGIQLLIVDPVADVFGGNEIIKNHARGFIRLLEAIARATDGAVLLLAHPSATGMANGTGTSGNVGWSNSARSRLYMRRPTKEEAEGADAPDVRIIERMKANFGRIGERIEVVWWRGFFALAGGAPSAPKEFDVYQIEVRLMSAIKQAVKQGRYLSLAKTSTHFAPKILSKYEGLGRIGHAKMLDIIEGLLSKDLLRQANVGKPSRSSAFIVPADADPLPGEISRDRRE